MGNEGHFYMKVRKYIPDRQYGFLIDTSGREAFFHVSCFEEGPKENNPPPVAEEEVLVTVDFDKGSEDNVPRASRVRRIQQPFHLKGIIENFDVDKGFGFLKSDDGNTYYLHRSEVIDGTLPMNGREASFYVSQRKRGARAVYIEIKIGAKSEVNDNE